MITALFALTLAGSAHAAPGTAEVFDCQQVNAEQYSDFGLRFAVDTSTEPEHALAAKLWDYEEQAMRIEGGHGLKRAAEYDQDGWIAWSIGVDEYRNAYLLLLPAGGTVTDGTVYVRELFGMGASSHMNEFVCQGQ